MTERNIGKYLHFYIGSEIQIEYGYPDDKKVGILTGFRAGAGWEIWPHKTSFVRVPKGERVVSAIVRDELVKPFLRPLKTMKEAEGEEIGIWNWWKANGFTGDLDIQNIMWESMTFLPEHFKELCKRGFDVFNLIPDGMAHSSLSK